VLREHLEVLAQLGLLVQRVSLERLESKARLGQLEAQDRLAQLARPVLLVLQVFKELQVPQEVQDPLVQQV